MTGSAGSAGEGPKPQRLRPRDAATLIVVDRTASEPRLLMGKRRMDQVFMPGKYVFPGGRVDKADRFVASADELRPADQAGLMIEMKGPVSAVRARALALAAIRETYEEAGLLIGGAGAAPRQAATGIWRSFLAQGFLPRPGALSFFARAITPPGRPRRFDTRFFWADAADVAHKVDTRDEELSSLDWFTIDEIRMLDLPAITRVVIEDLWDRLKDGSEAADFPIPFYHHRAGSFRRELLTLSTAAVGA
jgi:8-oxo-dGTP pyrophosphatase MutT (NUDIX family)